MPEVTDPKLAELIKENLDKPVLLHQFLRYQKVANGVIQNVWTHIDELHALVDILISVVDQDQQEDWVQKSLFALRNRTGRKVEISQEINLDREFLVEQLGEGGATEILGEGGGSMSLKGCHAVVVDCDPGTNMLLVRVLQSHFLLWVQEQETKEIDASKGVISRELSNPQQDTTGT